MRISRLVLNADVTKAVGLDVIKLDSKKLGSIVALVGKNGAGKSRILTLVKNYTDRIKPGDITSGSITHFPEFIKPNSNVKSFENKPTDFNSLAQKDLTLHSTVLKFSNVFARYSAYYVKVVNHDSIKSIKNKLENNLQFESIINEISSIDKTGAGKIINNYNEFDYVNSTSTISFINSITDELALDEYEHYKQRGLNPNVEDINTSAYKKFNTLKKYIRIFLDKEISYKDDLNRGSKVLSSKILLSGKPFNINLLSPGEKTLFAYAVLFFSYEIKRNINPKEYIIIIDEPELHLHPGAQIKLIDALKDLIKESGQLWIATHSLAILSHLNYSDILLVKDDKVMPPSTNNLEEIFRELMTVDAHREELSDFITSLSGWAFARFIKQCFVEPDVIQASNNDDPQFIGLKKFLQENKSIKLLDFGAGYGRVGQLLAEDLHDKNKINYSAFEPNTTLAKKLDDTSFITSVFSDVSKIPRGQYEIVLLCNVLHEISPTEWVATMNNIKRILVEGGYLFIIEDLLLPKGENANQFGYIILDNEHLDYLIGFDDTSHAIKIKNESSRYKDRLVFYAVENKYINTDKTCVWNAVASMHDHIFEKIGEIRKQEMDIKNSRIYANYCQQYINTKLASEELKRLKYTNY